MSATVTVKQQSWGALESHYQEISKRHLREFFADDPERGERMAAEAVGLYLDYSKNRVTDETLELLGGITEERSLHRYGPDKWSIRETLNHVTDTERVFVFRALWFGRGFDAPLPGFDQNVAVPTGRADEISWQRHVE